MYPVAPVTRILREVPIRHPPPAAPTAPRHSRGTVLPTPLLYEVRPVVPAEAGTSQPRASARGILSDAHGRLSSPAESRVAAEAGGGGASLKTRVYNLGTRLGWIECLMTSFSDRHGLSRKALQANSMDYELRTGLWNAVYFSYSADIYADRTKRSSMGPLDWGNQSNRRNPDAELIVFALRLRVDVMKQPAEGLDLKNVSLKREALLGNIKEWILKADWNRVYDLIEFFPKNYPEGIELSNRFRARVNNVLEKENARYRFIGNELAQITTSEEITEIEETLNLGGPFDLASKQIRQALRLLSDRENPDYRNSIKESISAVEVACRVVSGQPKATLGDALGAIRDESAHPVLRVAFDKLYGWTSDAAGIRHGMTEGASVGFAEAQFMVVACSAFTNYLAAKSRRADD